MQTNPLLTACRHLLEPIVRLCIRNNVPWAAFAETTKQAFVKVARRDYGLQGRPTNAARVAMLTGLSRREVGRVKDLLTGRSVGEAPQASRISQILTGWHVDPEFTVAPGKPADLPLTGAGASFEALLRRYAGDMPHGAIAKEMEQLGLLERRGDVLHAMARDYVRSPSDPDMLRQASVALHDHAATVVHNVDTNRDGPALFERMATRTDVPLDVAERFQRFVADRGQAFLEEVDAWLEQHASAADTRAPRKSVVRTGVGVYLIHDSAQEEHDDE